MKMILLSGKAESGKTTAAEMIKKMLENSGYNVVITRYAYYLKDLAMRYCGWNGRKDDNGRSLLQFLGTDVIRKKLNKPNFHVGRICEDVEICQNYVDYVIIDDTRFPNEIYYPKSIFDDKVFSVRIERPGHQSSLTKEQKEHLSEVALDDFKFDYVVCASDLSSLEEEVKLLVDEID